MATTHRSELIDELEKALRDEVYDGGMGALSPEQFTDYVRGLAVKAAKVVEEVSTPTDDEHLRTPDPQGEPPDARRVLLAECDKTDADMRKWGRVPVKFVRAALRAASAVTPVPWDRVDGCFGPCGPEGWYSPRRVQVNQEGTEA